MSVKQTYTFHCLLFTYFILNIVAPQILMWNCSKTSESHIRCLPEMLESMSTVQFYSTIGFCEMTTDNWLLHLALGTRGWCQIKNKTAVSQVVCYVSSTVSLGAQSPHLHPTRRQRPDSALSPGSAHVSRTSEPLCSVTTPSFTAVAAHWQTAQLREERWMKTLCTLMREGGQLVWYGREIRQDG